jgi:drug/metabolite transporter (DMT)-like permease
LSIVPVAFAAVVLMTLPYTLLMRLLPEGEAHGAGASVFGLAKGIGVLIGPLLAGLAITMLDRAPVGTFKATAGYAGAFGVAMILLLASIPYSAVSNAPSAEPSTTTAMRRPVRPAAPAAR